MYFQPTLTQSADNQVLSMKLKVSETRFLEYRYELKPNNYMLDFSVKSQGLDGVVNGSQDIVLDWKLKGRRCREVGSRTRRRPERMGLCRGKDAEMEMF